MATILEVKKADLEIMEPMDEDEYLHGIDDLFADFSEQMSDIFSRYHNSNKEGKIQADIDFMQCQRVFGDSLRDLEKRRLNESIRRGYLEMKKSAGNNALPEVIVVTLS